MQLSLYILKSCLFQAFMAVSRSSSAEEGYRHQCLLENVLNPLRKECSWVDFFAVSFVVDMQL